MNEVYRMTPEESARFSAAVASAMARAAAPTRALLAPLWAPFPSRIAIGACPTKPNRPVCFRAFCPTLAVWTT